MFFNSFFKVQVKFRCSVYCLSTFRLESRDLLFVIFAFSNNGSSFDFVFLPFMCCHIDFPTPFFILPFLSDTKHFFYLSRMRKGAANACFGVCLTAQAGSLGLVFSPSAIETK